MVAAARARPTSRTPTPGTRTWPGTWPRCCYGIPHVVTAHSLEPRRPWKAEQLGGGYRLSSWVERTAYEAADAVIAVSEGMRARRPRLLPGARPGRGARGPQRHRHRLLPPRPGPRRRGRPTGSTPTGRAWCSSGGSPGRRASGTSSRPPTRSTRPRRSCCARARRTPRRSRRRPRRPWPSCRAARSGVVWVAAMLPTRPRSGRCSPPPRCSSARRCTSRWASSTWRRWPAAPRWSRRTSAASPRSSTTATPACWCTTTRTRWRSSAPDLADAVNELLADPARAAAMGAAGPGAGRARVRVGDGRRRTVEIYNSLV